MLAAAGAHYYPTICYHAEGTNHNLRGGPREEPPPPGWPPGFPFPGIPLLRNQRPGPARRLEKGCPTPPAEAQVRTLLAKAAGSRKVLPGTQTGLGGARLRLWRLPSGHGVNHYSYCMG